MPPSRPPLHVILYGDSGAKKSTMAATFPKPMLVWMFDPWGKELPYVRRGTRRDGGVDAQGTPVTEIVSKKDIDKVLIRIEHYLDANLRVPEAYARFQARMVNLDKEYGDWATVVFDSATFAELTARKWHQYVLNPSTKNPMQWYGGSTDLIEEVLMGQLAAAPMNVVVVAHVDEDKDEAHGTMVRNPKMPGKRLRKGVAAGYMELYHLNAKSSPTTGESEWIVQTTSDALWGAATQIQAPNGCAPDYAALWDNFDKEGT